MRSARHIDRYELLLRGGSIYQPGTRQWRRQDLAVRGQEVALVSDTIDPGSAVTVVDVSELLVTPGLVDLHLHSYPNATFWGIDPDAVCLSNGVTTCLDAGSAGAFTFGGLARFMQRTKVRSRALLNIAGAGLATPYGELLSPELADVDAAVRVARAHPELIAGFKVRASPNTVGDHAAEALAAVRRAADELRLPVMVHVSEAPPQLRFVLEHLREGDILTHCFTPYDNSVVDARTGLVRPEVEEALARGVLLDVGHGSGSFSFPAAQSYAASGHASPIVSTDLHRKSILGPAFDMTTVMTKMLASGFSLEDVLDSASQRPARVLGLEAELTEGAIADIAVLSLDDGAVRLWDSRGNEREFDRRLNCRLTVRAGEVVYVDSTLRLEQA